MEFTGSINEFNDADFLHHKHPFCNESLTDSVDDLLVN